MPFLMRKIRRNSITKNKYATYFAYAIGEILLVVAGILIAIQIDKITREEKLQQEELESYQLIVSDLKRDSILFSKYQAVFTEYLNTYFALNKIANDGHSFDNIISDFIVSNVQFNPVTQNNHQSTIEKLRNNQIREQINNYFGNLSQVKQATDEFNTLIAEESRPYFLKEQSILDNEAVFNYSNKAFPPSIGVSTVDTTLLREVSKHSLFIPIISQLRMSIGFYLSGLSRVQQNNHELIELLESSLD